MIKVENLTYVYEDGYVALENINIDGNNGNIIGFIGNNGAGKSTLFLNILKILKPKKGKLYYENQEVKDNRKSIRDYREKVGMVFQDPDKQIFYSNVFDDIAFALRNIGKSEEEIKRRIDRVIEKLHMNEFYNKPVHFLSLGQKKRVAIGGAIVMDCNTILFDEPTAGLDPEITEEIVNILIELSKQGKKIFISSHDMELVYRICDYVYVMNKGKIIDEGKTKDIFLKKELLKQAALKEPWIVKLHKECGIPLFSREEEVIEYLKHGAE